MIVQAYPDKFIMIAQHDHAAISGLMAKRWKDIFFKDHHKRSSVEFAVRNHDVGWELMDEAPFWNEYKAAPYTFTDYPTAPKTVLYRYGIEEVAQSDNYAALLCSRHYSRFLQKNPSDAAQKFIREQEDWSKNVLETMSDFDKDVFDFHYGVLQMLDDISLFICLNEPGATGDDLHFFFKKGIEKHDGITSIPNEKLDIYWNDKQVVCLNPFPFTDTFTIRLKQRTVTKKMIEQKGLINSYRDAPLETIEIEIMPG